MTKTTSKKCIICGKEATHYQHGDLACDNCDIRELHNKQMTGEELDFLHSKNKKFINKSLLSRNSSTESSNEKSPFAILLSMGWVLAFLYSLINLFTSGGDNIFFILTLLLAFPAYLGFNILKSVIKK